MKHFLTLRDFSRSEILEMINLAIDIKKDTQKYSNTMAHKTLAMIFEKNSTRTRVSFETGIYQLGGHGIFLSSNDIQLSRGESIKDTSRVISSMVDMIMIRTFEHSRLEEFAKYSSKPIINGLSDSFHPAQLMADYLTMCECDIGVQNKTKPKVAYIGDGNNMANSWLMLASKLGFDLTIASPKGYEVDSKILAQSIEFAQDSGANINITNSPQEAITGANVATTDAWISMGQEELKGEKLERFSGFCVDENLMSLASNKCIFLHCLPAYRGQEVSDGVLEGTQSRVFQEAQNRLYAQKGIMVYLSRNQLC